ncbi:hypothetical protein NCG97_17145 [Streptomyces lydicamycinicus]|uniref:PqqD family peptide modification chaperone n=1 Tax=Streptomyces lydicamycinicus TaxID=1546107 RepID=UPI0020350600|nr:PqqD family peptide modification chaperone [Streptomyces lydicamycinicus]USA02001.1 hypothetical protein NCG97_17145 [Streptomyces lydicamycinicus]
MSTDTDDGTVLLNERTGRYWQLNATGGQVLRQLLDGHEAPGSPPRSRPGTASPFTGPSAT